MENPAAMTTFRAKRLLAGTLLYSAIIAVTLLVVDVACIAFGVFPPSPNYGDPDLGWRSAAPSGRMNTGVCKEFASGETYRYPRNEDGVRTSLSRREIEADSTSVKIGDTGDSQTDLCAPNEQIHGGVLQSELLSHGVPAIVLTFGAGRYSPLQAYLAFRQVVRPYHPRVLVLNVYTGNDLYDILRTDDRPHFVGDDRGYRIAAPVWFSLDDPAVRHRSRVLFALRELADKSGVRPLYLRLSELRRLGAEQGGGLGDVLAYMRDLWRARNPSVGYPDAFSAQILNQQLFFHHFPSSKEESIRRIRALMTLIRVENPNMLLVMSPLPSYEVVGEQPVDPELLRTLQRLPVSYEEGVQQEEALYERLRELAAEAGWIFVDNLAALRGYRGSERLFNNFDYHLVPTASALVGRAQATALVKALQSDAGSDGTQRAPR
jgi:hypothetical protein